MTPYTGAQLLVHQLKQHRVETIFCVPGESYLAVLDALYTERDAIRLIVARQEGGAAFMAEAYGKLTGQPGICFVTRGPGASNAAIGVHTARQDSTPLILFVGQVPRRSLEREAFQEIDYRQMFGSIAKWAAQIDDARRIPEYIDRAFQTACSGRPGPVVLALPEDMQNEEVALPASAGRPRASSVTAAPAAHDIAALGELLAQAERPLLLVGREGWTPTGIANLRAFAAAAQIPAIATVRAQDMIDNHEPYYVGHLGLGANPMLLQRVKESDLLLVVGSRLDGLSSAGYSLVDVPRPQQTFVHIYPDPEELGRVYQGDLLINATVNEFARVAGEQLSVKSEQWQGWRAELRQSYEQYHQPVSGPGEVNLAEIIAWLNRRLPADTIITNGAGNYTAWVHRFYGFSQPRTQLGPINGTMGYGVPAAVAAKIARPERLVVSFSGDGCFLMNGQELATAVQYQLNIIFIVINNGMYGTIRMHQEKHFPGRVYGTTLTNPNFADYAQAFGAHGAVVKRTEYFEQAFEEAVLAQKPALIEVRVDPEAILPGEWLTPIEA